MWKLDVWYPATSAGTHAPWRKPFQEAALRDGPVLALTDDGVQLAAKPFQSGDLATNVGEMLAGNGVDGFA